MAFGKTSSTTPSHDPADTLSIAKLPIPTVAPDSAFPPSSPYNELPPREISRSPSPPPCFASKPLGNGHIGQEISPEAPAGKEETVKGIEKPKRNCKGEGGEIPPQGPTDGQETEMGSVESSSSSAGAVVNAPGQQRLSRREMRKTPVGGCRHSDGVEMELGGTRRSLAGVKPGLTAEYTILHDQLGQMGWVHAEMETDNGENKQFDPGG